MSASAVPLSIFSIRRITDPADPALAAFGRVQEASYYAPESLIPPEFFPRIVAGFGNRQDRLLVAEDDSGAVLGGTIYSLLSVAGFNSFMGVSPAAQGQGVGRALQRASLDELRAAGLPGMFADSVHANRQNAAERQGEQRVGSDPIRRRQQLHALGFRVVDVPYWQPVGGPDGGPLADLDLLYCPVPSPLATRGPLQAALASLPEVEGQKSVPLSIITQTMLDYWRDWLGPERAQAEAEALAARAGKVSEVRLLDATQTPGYWAQQTQS